MKPEDIKKTKESANLMRSLDALVNASIEQDLVFEALEKFNDRVSKEYKLHPKDLVNYPLDIYNGGYTKHEALMATYIRMSSGLEMVEKFLQSETFNPYIDGEFLDDIYDDE